MIRRPLAQNWKRLGGHCADQGERPPADGHLREPRFNATHLHAALFQGPTSGETLVKWSKNRRKIPLVMRSAAKYGSSWGIAFSSPTATPLLSTTYVQSNRLGAGGVLWRQRGAYSYPDRCPREVRSSKGKLGENVSAFSPGAIKTRIKRSRAPQRIKTLAAQTPLP